MLERSGFSVVGAVGDIESALAAFHGSRPDVVLVDIDLGGQSGFDAVTALAAADSAKQTTLILVSTHDEDDFSELVAASPAAGFISKFALSAAAIGEIVAARR